MQDNMCVEKPVMQHASDAKQTCNMSVAKPVPVVGPLPREQGGRDRQGLGFRVYAEADKV
jgi:hypothetical protein